MLLGGLAQPAVTNATKEIATIKNTRFIELVPFSFHSLTEGTALFPLLPRRSVAIREILSTLVQSFFNHGQKTENQSEILRNANSLEKMVDEMLCDERR